MNITDINPEAPGRILIADDDEFNRLCLSAPLERLDYGISEAVDGQDALDQVAEQPPDLILLDLMMPKVDGIEVCRRLKQDPETSMIPIIMVTVLDDQDHRIRAIKAGADDFLNKPVDLHEVVLRVSNALRAKKTYDALQESYQKLNAIRITQQELTNMIVHDIRAPLSVALGHMEMLLTKADKRLDKEDKKWLEIALEGVQQTNNMSHLLLSVQQLESGELQLQKSEVDMISLCRRLIDSFQHLFSTRRLELACEEESAICDCDEELMRRILTNLLINAKKFTRDGGLIRLELKKTPEFLIVTCEDDGQGIPADFIPHLFDKYTQAETEMKHLGMGVGLAYCQLAVVAHGGHIEAESEEGKGTKFIVCLPSN